MTNSKNSRQSSGKSNGAADKGSRNGKEDRPDPDEEPVTESGSDIDPDKNIQIDDDPEQTKRKIPQMGK